MDKVCFVLCLAGCSEDCNVLMQPGRKTQLGAVIMLKRNLKI